MNIERHIEGDREGRAKGTVTDAFFYISLVKGRRVPAGRHGKSEGEREGLTVGPGVTRDCFSMEKFRDRRHRSRGFIVSHVNGEREGERIASRSEKQLKILKKGEKEEVRKLRGDSPSSKSSSR